MKYITEEQAIKVHAVLADFFEKEGDPISPAGVKSHDLLASALFRPQTSLGNTEKYTTVDEKAAALLCSLIQNHPFHNGNKRTALVCTLIFYDRSGYTIDASEDYLFNFLIDIAKNSIDGISREDNPEVFFNKVTRWLREHRYSYNKDFKDVETKYFIGKCIRLGASYKRSKGAHKISYRGRSICISQSTRRISANAIKRFYGVLHLSPAYLGINFDQLMRDGIDNLSCFSQLLPILRRLSLV